MWGDGCTSAVYFSGDLCLSVMLYITADLYRKQPYDAADKNVHWTCAITDSLYAAHSK